MADRIKVGDKAPDFSLQDTDLTTHKLSKYLGKKVVLAFFVTAFTTTCTMEVCQFRDSMSKLIDLEAQVIGISVNSAVSNRDFVESNHLPFPVLTDGKQEVIRTYGLTPEEAVGANGYEYVKRSVVILDKEGIVRYVWVANSATVEPNYDEIQKILKTIP